MKESIFKKCITLKKSVSGSVKSFYWAVDAFWAETVISQNFLDSLFLIMFVFLFVVVRHITDNDRSRFLPQDAKL